MTFTDYHLYIGQECIEVETGNRLRFSSIDYCTKDREITMITVRDERDDEWWVLNEDENITRIKLLLRPLESMTEEEHTELQKLMRLVTDGIYVDTPESFRWLLSKGFDLFGGIKAGWAIDKTHISPPTNK